MPHSKKKENLFLNIGLFGFFGQENDLVWNPSKNVLDWLQLAAAEEDLENS